MSEDENRKRSATDPEEAPPTEEELRQAGVIAALTDELVAGREVGARGGAAAVPGGDELLGIAAVIRASSGEVELPPERRRTLVREALAEGLAGRAPRRRPRVALAFFAAAAALLLVVSALLLGPLRPPSSRGGAGWAPRRVALSRPSDPLLGRPFADRAGASARIDLVFADRMEGYRRIRLGEEVAP
jgi:hypothetical protein